MKGKSNSLAVDYVLPDYTNVKRGYVRQSGEKSQQGEQVSASKTHFRTIGIQMLNFAGEIH